MKATAFGDDAAGLADCAGASQYELEAAMVKAVTEKESAGFSFVFSRVTKKQGLFTATIN